MNDTLLIESHDYKGFEIKIYQDEDADDPRSWDNLGTMACWHRRYSLGDVQPKESPDEYLEGIKDDIILPLYLYDHSGITMSTSHSYPYNDRWDAGQVGIIHVSKEKIKKEFGKKLITKKVREHIEQILKGEVETYDKFIRGDVYGYVVEFEGENKDSCWGFYEIEDALEQAKDIIEWEVEKMEENKEIDKALILEDCHD